MYTYTYKCVHICIDTFIHAHIHVYTRIYIYIYTYVCMYMYIRICSQIHTNTQYTNTHIYIYTNIYMYICILTNIHIHIYVASILVRGQACRQADRQHIYGLTSTSRCHVKSRRELKRCFVCDIFCKVVLCGVCLCCFLIRRVKSRRELT